MYLVDTNIVSEARRGKPQAVSWLRSVDPLTIHLSALTLGEIMRGIALKKKTDPKT
ncbi:type II toxin-antitoxin system VapC family toxin, partial [Rhizobium johnstonii]